MKESFMAIAGGFGLLIFAYLLLNNKDASIGILNSTFTGVQGATKVLQGRG